MYTARQNSYNIRQTNDNGFIKLPFCGYLRYNLSKPVIFVKYDNS